MAKRPTLTAADFSIDGTRIRLSVAKWLHGLGFRYCPRCCAGEFPRRVLPLDRFGHHDRPRETAWCCRECAAKITQNGRKEKQCVK